MNTRDSNLRNVEILHGLVEQKQAQLAAIEARIELALSQQDIETWSQKWDETYAEMNRIAQRASELNYQAWHENHEND